jgi:putative hydrolase of the HAD superfamily
MPAIRAVIFDFFGTLTHCVRRGPAHRSIADLLGCPLQTMLRVLDDSFYLRASGRLGDAEATLRWVCRQAGTAPSETALRAAVALRQRVLRSETRLRTDAVPVLAALRERGILTGLISDCTHELPAFLPQLAVAPLLDARVFSVEAGHCKPDPALYLDVCHRLDVEPRECLYLGDGGSQELTGAERAGMTAIRLAAPDLAGHLVFNPDRGWRGAALRRLGEVVELLGPAGTVAAGRGAGPAALPGALAHADG